MVPEPQNSDQRMDTCRRVVERRGAFCPKPAREGESTEQVVVRYLREQMQAMPDKSRGYLAVEFAANKIEVGDWELADMALQNCCMNDPAEEDD